MRNFETPIMNISMFDSVVITTEGGTYITESIVSTTIAPIAALDTQVPNALVGRTSFNALMQVNQ